MWRDGSHVPKNIQHARSLCCVEGTPHDAKLVPPHATEAPHDAKLVPPHATIMKKAIFSLACATLVHPADRMLALLVLEKAKIQIGCLVAERRRADTCSGVSIVNGENGILHISARADVGVVSIAEQYK